MIPVCELLWLNRYDWFFIYQVIWLLLKVHYFLQRFFPSEFGNDVDRIHAVGPAKTAFGIKAQIRRAIEAEGIPYTYVSSNFFAGFFLPRLSQLEATAAFFVSRLSQPGATGPPRDKIIIPGDGNPKGKQPLKIIKQLKFPFHFLLLTLECTRSHDQWHLMIVGLKGNTNQWVIGMIIHQPLAAYYLLQAENLMGLPVLLRWEWSVFLKTKMWLFENWTVGVNCLGVTLQLSHNPGN